MFKKLLKSKLLWFFTTLMVLYSAFHFSTNRTIAWEEEVPLNTGETIWVKRSIPWELRGGAGNPFDLGMRPLVSKQLLEFYYRGTLYSYSGGAAVGWIVIDASGKPNLVATAADWSWADRNKYYCVVPFYVQLIPSTDGKSWHWPKQIGPWLYGLPYNLMASIPRLNESAQDRYTVGDRIKRDTTYQVQFPEGTKIDSEYKASCIKEISNSPIHNGTKK